MIEHGTLNGYIKLRCRCAPCRAANAAYHRGYRARHAEARRAYNAFMMRVYRGRQAGAA